MPTTKPPTIKQLQAECDRFNKSVAVGDEVFVKLDAVDEPYRTRTRSKAEILGNHSAVIWLDNVSGCYLLDRVTAINDTGPIYGVQLIDTLPVGGMMQAMPNRADLEQVREVNERTAAAYEVLLSHYVKLKAEHEGQIGCVIRNCVNIDDTPQELPMEPGPMTGPTWAKVAHVMGIGATSAIALCREYDVDPDFDCAKVR